MAPGEQAGVERCVERLEPGHQARHVRALLLGRQRDVERPRCMGVLHGTRHAQLQRVAHVLDAHALDGEVPVVTLALRVGNVEGVGQLVHGNAFLPGVPGHAFRAAGQALRGAKHDMDRAAGGSRA
jgi:hypothetical protein